MEFAFKRPVRACLQGGAILATILTPGLAASQGNAQETRFVLRNGSTVCGTVIGEQGIGLTVQTAAGLQVALRRDQIARRQNEPCDPPAASAAAPAASAAAAPASNAPAAAPAPSAPAAARPAAAQPAAPQVALRELRFAGSSSVGERLVPDLVDAYLGNNNLRLRGWAAGRGQHERMQEARGANGAGIRAYVETAGTGSAFSALGEQRVDIGMASRLPTSDEAAQVQRAINVDVTAAGHLHVLAVGGLGIIVHPSNPVQKLTLEQVHGIFTGAITNWSQVGGPNRAIVVHAFEQAGSATNDVFNAEVLRGRPLVRSADRLPTQPEIATAVASEAGGIGYVALSFVGQARALNLVTSCGLEFEASEFSVKAEDYPLERRLYLISGQPGTNPVADEFLRWATSTAATETVREAGYVSTQPVLGTREYTQFRLADAARAAPQAPDGRYTDAMSNYTLAVRNAQRLSTTFRFERSNTQLDVRGQQDIERVAEFLKQAENQRYRVNVLGFADNAGAFGQNRTLSERRAQEVARLLRERGATVQLARGFAHVAPVACDEDLDAPTKNRRVEIWLSPG